ncbi:calcitonin receptor isoform X2 [Rhagoletis pomonella]|uniref:calcitonin receptor isoform X2 n=1 Tax=Rhagoletis pomonella TaxID=28610 RepID=UPI00177FA519|nr:calcitonin receptor isoform X2 [Rhagoletis pomonella]
MAFLFEPFQSDNQYLREFLSHLYLNCIIRYQNESGLAANDTDDDANYIGVPRYLEDAVLSEGTIDLTNVDEAKVEQNELFAYISKHSLKPTSATASKKRNTQTTSNATDTYSSNFSLVAATTPASATSLYATDISASTTYSTAATSFTSSGQLRFCPLRFDGYLCWPRTPAGTVLSQYCPEFVEGFNRKFLAHKTCLENGTWYHHPVSGREWSNYTNCIDYDDLEPWCILLHFVVHYFMLVNYFWMFCEGLHLHLVLVVVFVKDTIVMRWFKLFAWMSPILFLLAYGVARFFHPDDNVHCWMDDSLLLWILSVPICASLLASFVFLINVLRVIVRKLHPQSAQPAPLAIRKAVRATIILIPLFGLQHFLLPYRPDTGTPLERFYQILSVILVSLQGFVVSFLFCFANHDVTFAIRSLLNRLMPGLVSPPPPGTHTGQMATTTPSRELGV